MIGRDALSGALKEKDEDLMTHMDSTSESQPQATAPTVSPYSAEKPGRDCPRKGHATMAVQIAHDTRWRCWVEALLVYGLWLPMTLTADSTRPVVRVLGLAAFMVWMFPATVVLMLPILVTMIVGLIVDAWRGKL